MCDAAPSREKSNHPAGAALRGRVGTGIEDVLRAARKDVRTDYGAVDDIVEPERRRRWSDEQRERILT